MTAAKTWDQIRNAQTIAYRRERARTAIKSLRFYRQEQTLTNIEMLVVTTQVRERISQYRLTNSVLVRNI